MLRFYLAYPIMSSYKTECPSCGGHNFYVTEHNGMGYCFNCGYCELQGKHKQAPKVRSKYLEEIRHFYKRMAEYYHSQLEGKALQYVYDRGFTDETIKHFKIGYIPHDKSLLYRNAIAKESGLADYYGGAFLGGRISFPYISKDGTVTDIRGRDITGEDELKYKSPHGGTYFRGADYPYNCAVSHEPSILLTEGEIKTGIAWQFGYTIMGLPGMGSWRHGWKPREDQEVIIVFDRQDDDIYNIRRAVYHAAQYIPTVKVATLPHQGQSKMDVDTLLLNYGKELFDFTLRAALPYEVWRKFQR